MAFRANTKKFFYISKTALQSTNNRTQGESELEVENLGAHLNAYTLREQIVYYANCFSKDLPQSKFHLFFI
jgi:processing peptidase subunit beta